MNEVMVKFTRYELQALYDFVSENSSEGDNEALDAAFEKLKEVLEC